MAAVTVWRGLEPPQNKVCHCFHCFPIYLPWSDGMPWSGTRYHDLVFWILSFKPAFPLSYFTFIKRLFSSSLLSAIRVISSAYLRWLIFLPAILIPACDWSCPHFRWCTLFPVLNQSIVACLVLTVASLPAYRILRRQVRWSDIPISLRIFHSFLWSKQRL